MILSLVSNSFILLIGWFASYVLVPFGIILAITIFMRALNSHLIFLLPKDNWWRRRQMMEPRAKQLVLITGATSGIGLAVAKHLHSLGFSVAAGFWPGAPKSEPGFLDLQRIAEQVGSRMHLIELDVSDGDSIAKAYIQIEQLLERPETAARQLYALINNAGLGSLQPLAWLQRRSIKRLVETNLLGSLLVTREFLPLLAKGQQTGGDGPSSRLIFVSSGLGFVPGATYATYGVTKAAQIYLSKCTNLELKQRYKIQSIAVIPHNFIKNTNICAQNVKNNLEAWQELKPLERQIYRQEFEHHESLVRSLEQATKLTQVRGKEQSDVKNKGTQALKQHKSSPPGGAIKPLDKFKNFINLLVASLKGENLALTLEESGVLEGFELALRLRNPPEIIFAGDSAFQLIVGSMLLLLPPSWTGLLSNSVAPSLYR